MTGFADAESCFGLYIYKNTSLKTGWYVFLNFNITLHKKDINLLNQIKNFFGVGIVSNHRDQSKQYNVKSVKDIKIIIDPFDKFPLMTKKLDDYRLFKKAYNLILNKEHLTHEGIEKLIVIKNSINRGLSPEILNTFSNLKFEDTPIITKKRTPF